MTGSAIEGRRVLVLEDEMLLLMLVEDMLSDAGCEMIAARDVAHAMALVDEETFNAAILDVNLDGETSYPVAELLRSRGKPFLFATGYGLRGLRPEYRDHPVISKPYQQNELIEKISAAIRSGSGSG